MSKGSQVIPVRIPADLLDQMARQVESRNRVAQDEPWTRSSFILAAIREKLAKMQRSRSGRKRKAQEGPDHYP